MRHMRGEAHAFLTTRYNNIRIAKLDVLGAKSNRAKT